MPLNFEWDEKKAKTNATKHGVGFEEAATVFADPLSLTIPDPSHSQTEERFVLLGKIARRKIAGCLSHGKRRSSAHHQCSAG